MRPVLIGFVSLAGLLSAPSLAVSQAQTEGQECRPPVASASAYRDCRVRLVAGQTVCRCAIAPGLEISRRSSVVDAVSAAMPASPSVTPVAQDGSMVPTGRAAGSAIRD